MNATIPETTVQARLEGWIASVRILADQLEQWCNDLQWPVQRDWAELDEPQLGTYRVPTVRVRMPNQSILYLVPIALMVGGGCNGRVDLESWPSLNRVRLSMNNNRQWEIWTDSNVRLHEPWGREAFEHIAQNLSLPT